MYYITLAKDSTCSADCIHAHYKSEFDTIVQYSHYARGQDDRQLCMILFLAEVKLPARKIDCG